MDQSQYWTTKITTNCPFPGVHVGRPTIQQWITRVHLEHRALLHQGVPPSAMASPSTIVASVLYHNAPDKLLLQVCIDRKSLEALDYSTVNFTQPRGILLQDGATFDDYRQFLLKTTDSRFITAGYVQTSKQETVSKALERFWQHWGTVEDRVRMQATLQPSNLPPGLIMGSLMGQNICYNVGGTHLVLLHLSLSNVHPLMAQERLFSLRLREQQSTLPGKMYILVYNRRNGRRYPKKPSGRLYALPSTYSALWVSHKYADFRDSYSASLRTHKNPQVIDWKTMECATILNDIINFYSSPIQLVAALALTQELTRDLAWLADPSGQLLFRKLTGFWRRLLSKKTDKELGLLSDHELGLGGGGGREKENADGCMGSQRGILYQLLQVLQHKINQSAGVFFHWKPQNQCKSQQKPRAAVQKTKPTANRADLSDSALVKPSQAVNE